MARIATFQLIATGIQAGGIWCNWLLVGASGGVTKGNEENEGQAGARCCKWLQVVQLAATTVGTPLSGSLPAGRGERDGKAGVGVCCKWLQLATGIAKVQRTPPTPMPAGICCNWLQVGASGGVTKGNEENEGQAGARSCNLLQLAATGCNLRS
jgi:hypothetical protein